MTRMGAAKPAVFLGLNEDDAEPVDEKPKEFAQHVSGVAGDTDVELA